MSEYSVSRLNGTKQVLLFLLGFGLSACVAFLSLFFFFLIVDLLENASIGILNAGYLPLLLASIIPLLAFDFFLLFLFRKKGIALKSGIITGCLFIVIPAAGMNGWMESQQTLESRLRWANPRTLQEVSNKTSDALNNKDAAVCMGLKGTDAESTESLRAGCLMNVAVHTNDPSLCEAIQISSSAEQDRRNTTNFKDQCFYTIAMQRNDTSLCNRAPSEQWRSRCTAGIAWRIQQGIVPVPPQVPGSSSFQSQISSSQTITGMPECTAPPEDLAIGSKKYPSFQEYERPNGKRLAYLGRLFTAARCGPERLKEAFGGEQANYPYWSEIVMYEEPTGEFLNVLLSIGYESAGASGTRRDWFLRKTVKVSDLLRLLPYASKMEAEGPINVG